MPHPPTLPIFTPLLWPCRSHHLRKLDRNMNGINFPSLYFPELYLLHGGYKAMFTSVQAKGATAVSPSHHAHSTQTVVAGSCDLVCTSHPTPTPPQRYCEPSGYLPMHDEEYKEDLRLFMKRSKSWNAGCAGRELGRKRCDLFGSSQRGRRATARADSSPAATQLTLSQP